MAFLSFRGDSSLPQRHDVTLFFFLHLCDSLTAVVAGGGATQHELFGFV